MSIAFNNTFTADKPIIYPSNWGSGKTALQEYEQFKASFTFYVIRNIMEAGLAALWVFIVFVLVLGVKEIFRLRGLKDTDLEKISNRKYIGKDFVFGIAWLAGIVGLMSGIVLYQDWGLFVLVKGIVCFTVIYLSRNYINKGLSVFFNFVSRIGQLKTKKKEKSYQKLEEENQD